MGTKIQKLLCLLVVIGITHAQQLRGSVSSLRQSIGSSGTSSFLQQTGARLTQPGISQLLGGNDNNNVNNFADRFVLLPRLQQQQQQSQQQQIQQIQQSQPQQIIVQSQPQQTFVQTQSQPQQTFVHAQPQPQQTFVQVQPQPQHTFVQAQPQHQQTLVQAQPQHQQIFVQAQPQPQQTFVQAQHQQTFVQSQPQPHQFVQQPQVAPAPPTFLRPDTVHTSQVTSPVQASAIGTGSHHVSQHGSGISGLGSVLSHPPSPFSTGSTGQPFGMSSAMGMMGAMDPLAALMGDPMGMSGLGMGMMGMGGMGMGGMGMGGMGMGMGMGMPFMTYDTMEDILFDTPDRRDPVRMGMPVAPMGGAALGASAGLGLGASSAVAAPAAPAAASSVHVAASAASQPAVSGTQLGTSGAAASQVDPALILSALQAALSRVQQGQATATTG